VLGAVGQIRGRELTTALLMFSCSFLAMTTHNIIKPVTRSKFIADLGASNLPYVQLAAGLLIGLIMAGYTWLMSRLPRRWAIPITQAGISAVLVAFWFLFRTGQEWVSVAFYLLGLILGILLISQFWTLANVVYDPRQAKRLFGFIGAGASLGGIAGSSITTGLTRQVGTENLVLFSAGAMLLCLIAVAAVIRRENISDESLPAGAVEEAGVGLKRALELLRGSKHLQIIALVISFAAIGAAIIEQQLNMATEAIKGRSSTDAITGFLAQVQLGTSVIGFIIQIALTSRIHRYLGIGFALLLLPVSLGSTALVMLFNAALWAPSLARVFDQSLRYTVDKTTREILYMPLPTDIKFEAKPFVDVTVDRFAKGLGAVLLVVLIQPWGLGFTWQQVSYVSVLMTVVWIVMAVRAKHAYQAAFRHGIETKEMKPAELRVAVADLSTIETLIQELASPEEPRVLYAIDLLESLDKKHLVTPLLLYHDSAAVRVRALGVIAGAQPEISAQWLPAVRNMLGDADPEVRAAAVGALAKIRHEQVTELVRPMIEDGNPRIAVTAAMVLAGSSRDEDASAAEEVLTKLISDTRESAAPVRRDFAVAIRHITEPRFRRLLIPLLSDPDPDVAAEAMHSVRQLGLSDFIFIPTLISLLRDRRLKSSAREMLVSAGEPALGILGHFLRDPEEDLWIRRHLPATIARIPCQKSVDTLIEALDDPDGFLRFKAITALDRLRRTQPGLDFPSEPLEAAVLREGSTHEKYRRLHRRGFIEGNLPQVSLLGRALAQKIERAQERIYLLLGLLYPWKEIASARWAIRHGDVRARAGALEYLDNLLKGAVRKQLMPLLDPSLTEERPDELGAAERARAANDALSRLIDDADPVIAASALALVWELGRDDLTAEVERILASRDVRDWFVFEAASWVLAGFRLRDRTRRELWREPLPAVELAQQLHNLPLFSTVSADELFRLAAAGRQVRCEAGRMLLQEGIVPAAVQFLLDGCASLRKGSAEGRTVAAPAALGLQEVLENSPSFETARTLDPTVCLELTSEEFLTLTSDNAEFVHGLFRMLAEGAFAERNRLLLKGHLPEESAAIARRGLKPIEKVLVLQSIPLFSEINAGEMLSLASIAEEIDLQSGAVLFRDADAPAIHVLLTGRLSLESSPGEPALAAGPGDSVGFFETCAGIQLGCQAKVECEGTALRIDREELFDLLGQRPGLLRQLFGELFRSQNPQP
jgi:CRP-like cAMP-binding protein/HEAT repeat protein